MHSAFITVICVAKLRGMYLPLLLVLSFAVGLKGLHVHGSSGLVMVQQGGAVLLPCFAPNPVSLEDLQVEWTKADSLVNVFQQGKSGTELQSQSFRGRVDFFPNEVSKGNFSILLKNVAKEDAGVYRCRVNSVNDSHETILEMKLISFSALHVSILLSCLVALLITVGLCFPAFRDLKNKVASRTGLTIQAVLMLCPNIFMSVAYVLWSKEGFLYEGLVCSVVSIIRPIMLMKTSPYLNAFPDRLQKDVKARALPYHFFFITMAALSALASRAIDNISNAKEINETIKTIIAVATTVYFLGAVIAVMCLPFQRVSLTMLLETLNGLLLARFALFACTTGADFDLNLQIISVMPHLVIALVIVLLLQNHCFRIKPFKYIHMCVSFIVITYSLMDICIYVFITITMQDFSRAWILLFEAVIFIVAWLAVIFLYHCRKEEFCSLERGKSYLCCTLTAVIGTIIYGAASLYFTAKLLENIEDGAGYMALNVLIHVLATTALFKHPKHLPDLPHIMIYMFGAVGLTVINSITLASELIMKAAEGGRTIEDLRLIVLPFETLFVFGWLALQIYDTWIRAEDGIMLNFEDQTEAGPELHPDTESLMANMNHPTSLDFTSVHEKHLMN